MNPAYVYIALLCIIVGEMILITWLMDRLADMRRMAMECEKRHDPQLLPHGYPIDEYA